MGTTGDNRRSQLIAHLAALDADLVWVAVLGAVGSVISAFYYLRIVYYMYFGEETDALDTGGSPVLWGFLMASAAIMVVGVINLFGIDGLAASAATIILLGGDKGRRVALPNTRILLHQPSQAMRKRYPALRILVPSSRTRARATLACSSRKKRTKLESRLT
mgnify:CR=1 FL=1